ncbi:ABC transporter ATP-binding protein [Phenylobacterium sp. LjRoot225]|uniref:ABC transporter ATP-binding protein n=1 Tax=Phenylobacterium sp. LjRoot225 TaxID=3342285 RepID=UPI003ED0F08B
MRTRHARTPADQGADKSYLDGFRALLNYLSPRRRRQGALVLLCMLVVATAEFLTLGSILPFLAVVADPRAPDRYPALAALLALLHAQQPRAAVTALAALFGAMAITTAAIRILMTWVSQKFVFRLGHDIGVMLYKRVLYQPYSYHISNSSSEILSSVNKVQQVVGSVMLPVMQGLTSVTITLFILVGLSLVNVQVAFGCAAAFGLIYFAVSKTSRAQLRLNSKIIAHNNTLRLKTVQEGLGGIRDVIIDQAQPVYVRKFAEVDTKVRDAQAVNAMISVTPRFVLEGLGMAAIALLALLLSQQEGGLNAALPTLGALAIGSQRLLPLLQQIYNSWTQVTGNQAALFDVLGVLERPMPVTAPPGAQAPTLPFTRAISLQEVTFRYSQDGPEVLRNIDLKIAKGSRVGFIGRTGSGKSTIIDLIMGLLAPTSGAILVDDAALDAHNITGWQRQISHVPQAIYLSDATIIENIAFGVDRREIDVARVHEAARKADIEDFILSRKAGYETLVGERGIQLSGGQRQRIGLARALYRQSNVLIFDEATNALDDETEESVMQAIDRLGGDITVLIIAHRLTTLKNCDLICRVDQGRIVARGSYQQIVLAADKIASA